ncbi:hypothetical protein DE146DRAFT_671730 [Phaeosphaeria sp. MPI-PUGE-AT-0046c]|nr:hypothetical protein DE146DRAFT_671730 [Phaeosphaeria sp. MPI-PUGE-AT-0046c]
MYPTIFQPQVLFLLFLAPFVLLCPEQPRSYKTSLSYGTSQYPSKNTSTTVAHHYPILSTSTLKISSSPSWVSDH